MITYAQNFEDVMLQRLVGGEREGFYVDIGAWHPTLHSVTRHFYELGWNGINVEPIRAQHALFLRDRPRDINLNVAVSDRRGRLEFFECEDSTALSTADPAQGEALRLKGHCVRTYEVETVTLADVAARCEGRTVQFLKIDVEGLEERILRGADWTRFRPRVLLIEATKPDTPVVDWDATGGIEAWSAWEPLLLAGGYRFAWYDGLSRFYVREEDARLAGRLRLPPGVHDDIQFPDEGARVTALREAMARLEEAVGEDRRAKDAVVRRLEEETAAIRADQAAKQGVIDRLISELAQSEDVRRLLDSGLAQARDLARGRGEVIRVGAESALRRKASLGGIADTALRLRPGKGMPQYGRWVPAAARAPGMHVAIDSLEIVFGVSGGVETYMEMLVQALLQGGMNVTVLCLPDQLSHLQARFGARAGYFCFGASPAMRAAVAVARRLGRRDRILAESSLATFSRLREDLGVDILHSPVQIYSVADFRVPAVLNLHDLQHLHFPENFRPSDIEARNRLYGLAARLAAAVVTSSDFVRNDVVTRMAVPGGKVFTVPVTWNPKVEAGLAGFGAQDARRHYGLPATFAFYPAQFWPHKNHARLIEALAITRGRRPASDLKLVLTGFRGHSGWAAAEAATRAHAMEAHVLCLDHVPVEHLAGLYKACAFCVVPSTFEASSYPVIEAQVLGVPAMCANVTSLPELVRDGCGLLFDPFDPGDIARAMVAWLDDPADAAAQAAKASVKVRREHGLESYIRGVSAVYEFARTQES